MLTETEADVEGFERFLGCLMLWLFWVGFLTGASVVLLVWLVTRVSS